MSICEFKINADFLHEKKSVYFSEMAYLLDFKIKIASMKTDMKDT